MLYMQITHVFLCEKYYNRRTLFTHYKAVLMTKSNMETLILILWIIHRQLVK